MQMTEKKMKNKILDSRLFWFILSLIISIGIWTYITGVENDEYTRNFRGVRLEFVGEDTIRASKNLVITDASTNSVNVEISGPRRVIASLDASELVAQVDVSKISRSAYTTLPYTIVFPSAIDKTNLTVKIKNPETVSFVTSEQVSKTLQVRGSFNGNLAEGFTAAAPVFEPSFITVSGPEAYLKDVDYAWVTFSGENVSSSLTAESGLVLKDKDGEDCSATGITFSEETIVCTLPVLMVKEVPVTVELIYGAGADETNTVVEIDPQTITLAGDATLLSGKNKVSLGSINLADVNSPYSSTFSIIVDDGITVRSGETEATVTVEMVGLVTKSFVITDLSYINVTEGYTAEVLTNSLTVTLRGTPEALEEINAENIRAVVDLKDYDESEGQYSVEAVIYPGPANVGAVGDYSLTVEIKKG